MSWLHWISQKPVPIDPSQILSEPQWTHAPHLGTNEFGQGIAPLMLQAFPIFLFHLLELAIALYGIGFLLSWCTQHFSNLGTKILEYIIDPIASIPPILFTTILLSWLGNQTSFLAIGLFYFFPKFLRSTITSSIDAINSPRFHYLKAHSISESTLFYTTVFSNYRQLIRTHAYQLPFMVISLESALVILGLFHSGPYGGLPSLLASAKNSLYIAPHIAASTLFFLILSQIIVRTVFNRISPNPFTHSLGAHEKI